MFKQVPPTSAQQSPNSDQHQISPHHISAFKHIEVMRIKELITEDQLS